MSWEYDLADEFKKRNNSKPIGPCIGRVTSVKPFAGNILNGQILLDASNSYVCDTLLERKSKMRLKGTFKESGETSIDNFINSSGYQQRGNIEIDADIELEEVLKIGDQVLVIPAADEQTFFIVDIIKGV